MCYDASMKSCISPEAEMAQNHYKDHYTYLCFSNTGRKTYITHLARLSPGANYHMKKTRIARHLIDYVESGRGYVEHRGVRYEVEAGDLIYIKKDIAVNYGSDGEEPYEKLWFACDGPLTDALSETYLDGRELIIVKNTVPDTWHALMEVLGDGIHDEISIGHILLDFFRTLGEQGAEQGSDRSKSGLAEQIRACLEDDDDRFDTLDGLAEHFHISKRHLSRVFRERYGVPPIAYRCERRLNNGARYLAETDFSVAEIASRTGYTDQSQFSAAFRKHFGLYPLQYRKQHK